MEEIMKPIDIKRVKILIKQLGKLGVPSGPLKPITSWVSKEEKKI